MLNSDFKATIAKHTEYTVFIDSGLKCGASFKKILKMEKVEMRLIEINEMSFIPGTILLLA